MPAMEPAEERAQAGPRTLWLVLLPALLVLAVYARTLGFDFVWDDRFLSLSEVYARADLRAILTSPANGLEYLPVRDLTLVVDHALWGKEPAGFHATNVALFAAAAGLMGLFQRALWRRESAAAWAPLLCALVFAAHPLQVEPVAFVTARNALCALLFGLAALLAWTRHVERGERWTWGAAFACVAAALFSKATALALPLVLPLVELRLRPERTLPRAALRALPLLLLAPAVAALHAAVASQTGALGGGSAPALLARLPRAAFVPLFYLWKTVWPVGLTIEYDLSPFVEHAWATGLGALAVAAALLLVVVRGHRERTLPWLAALGYGLFLLPVSNLLPTEPPVADRYAQLPLLWLVPLLLAFPLRRLSGRVALGAGALLVAVLAVASFAQTRHWKDDASLFRRAAELHADSAKVLGNLGMRLWDEGRRDQALEVFRKLSAEHPRDYRLPYAEGLLAMERGDQADAARLLERASEGTGRTVYLADRALGLLAERRGREARALAAYRRALERVPPGPAHAQHRRDLRARVRRLEARLGPGRGG